MDSKIRSPSDKKNTFLRTNQLNVLVFKNRIQLHAWVMLKANLRFFTQVVFEWIWIYINIFVYAIRISYCLRSRSIDLKHELRKQLKIGFEIYKRCDKNCINSSLGILSKKPVTFHDLKSKFKFDFLSLFYFKKAN